MPLGAQGIATSNALATSSDALVLKLNSQT